jgi:2-hydroxy-6-oxonona-2,4-dienedioate hydrolase
MATIWVDLLGAQVRYGGRKYPGRYLEAGAPEAEPLILLHGQGGHVENFCRNVMPYAQHFHVFALDCVWHGLGPQPPFNPELLPTYVDQVLDFMDWQGIEAAHIEGQSMGGWTAMRLAYEHPQRVKKLVLTTTQGFRLTPPPGVEAAPVPSRARGERQLEFLRNPTWENIRLRMVGLLARPERLPDEMIAVRRKLYSLPATNASLQLVAQHYLGGPDLPSQKYVMTEHELSQIKAPTLVYWGDKNPVPPVMGERLAAAIPGAQYYCAADTGHWAQFEHANEHNRVVLRFLTGDATLEPLPVEEEAAVSV